MRHDRERSAREPRSGAGERGEYGTGYEGPFGGRGAGEPAYAEGAERPRPGLPPRAFGYAPSDEERDVFEWGPGYIGGRGYGGTNYDLDHGYATRPPFGAVRGRWGRPGRSAFRSAPPGDQGAGAWGEPEPTDEYGPARYGYGPYYDRLRRRRRSDTEIRGEVEDALFYDTWVDADAISVSVEDGVVTLSGILPSFEELRYAVDDAWDVDGVRGVRSELDVDEGGADARARASASQADPQWRSHLHGHPEAGERAAEGSSGSAAGAARPRGRRTRAKGAGPEGGTEGSARGTRGRGHTGATGGRARRGRAGGEAAAGGNTPATGAAGEGSETASPGSMEGGASRPQ